MKLFHLLIAKHNRGGGAAIPIGDSQSPLALSSRVVDTTSTTDTLNVKDATANGLAFVVPPASGTFTKTVHKSGVANSKVYSKSRLGYVRLNNTTSQGVKIGNANLKLTNRSVIGVLCRLDASQLNSYTGDFNVLKTSQNGASGKPYILMGIGGSTSTTNTSTVRKYFFTGREGKTAAGSVDSVYDIAAQYNGIYSAYFDPFGVQGTPFLTNKWVWLWMLSSDATDQAFTSFNYADDASFPRKCNTTRLVIAENGCFPNEKGVSSRETSFGPLFEGQCQFTGQMIGTTTLTVSAMLSGAIVINSTLAGSGVANYRAITAQLTGTPGGVGTYTVSGAVQTFGPTTVTCPGITPAYFDGSDGSHPLIDFVLGSGSSGTGKVVDVARVIKLSTFPCGFGVDGVNNIGYDVIGQLSNGMHPDSIPGLMTADDFCLDFDALPSGCTNINSPTYNPAADGPILHRYHGTNASDVTLSVTNQRIA